MSQREPGRAALLAAMQAIHQGVALIDTGASEWPVRWFNPAFAVLTANRAGAIGDDSVRTLLERLGGTAAVDALRDAVAAATEAEWPVDVTDGPRLAVRYVPLTDARGIRSREGWLMLRYDDADEAAVREREVQGELATSRRRLKEVSDDPATGLAGEQRFRECLRRDMALASRQRSALSVIVLRMDAFEAYRDTFGGHATDSCLRMLARTVSRRLRRGSDLAGRAGEDCLAMLMHDVGPEETAAFAERIAADVDALRIHHPRSDTARYVTVTRAERSVVPEADTDADAWFDELLDSLGRTVAPPILNRA